MSLLFFILYLSNLCGRLYGSTPANAENIPAEPSSVSAPAGTLATDSANTSVNSGGIVRDSGTGVEHSGCIHVAPNGHFGEKRKPEFTTYLSAVPVAFLIPHREWPQAAPVFPFLPGQRPFCFREQ